MRRRENLRWCAVVATVLAGIAVAAPATAGSVSPGAWPDQPYHLPEQPRHCRLPEEDIPSHWYGIGRKFVNVRSGGLVMVGPFGGFLFKSAEQLRKFWNTGNINHNAPFLKPLHVVKAMSDIHANSDGGLAFDDKFGAGFIVILPNADWLCTLRNRIDRLPDPTRLPGLILRRSRDSSPADRFLKQEKGF